jgi:hypothetical protein
MISNAAKGGLNAAKDLRNLVRALGVFSTAESARGWGPCGVRAQGCTTTQQFNRQKVMLLNQIETANCRLLTSAWAK